MKKIISIAIIFALCFSIASCKRKPEEKDAVALSAQENQNAQADTEQGAQADTGTEQASKPAETAPNKSENGKTETSETKQNNPTSTPPEPAAQEVPIKKTIGPVNYDEYLQIEEFEKYPVVGDGILSDYGRLRTLEELEKYSDFIAIITPTAPFAEETVKDKQKIKGFTGAYTYSTTRNYSVLKVIKGDENTAEITFKEKQYFDKDDKDIPAVLGPDGKRINPPAVLCGSGTFIKKYNSKYLVFCTKDSDGKYSIRIYQGAYCIDGTDWSFLSGHNYSLFGEILEKYKDLLKDYFPYDKVEDYERKARGVYPIEDSNKDVREFKTLAELEKAADLILVASTKTDLKSGKVSAGVTVRDFEVAEVLKGDFKQSTIKIKEYASINQGIEQKDIEYLSAKKDVLVCKKESKYLLFLKKEADGTYNAYPAQGGYCLDRKDMTYIQYTDKAMYEAIFVDYNNLFVKY